MTTSDPCGDFLAAVENLREDTGVRLTAHTSSVSADAWTDETPTTQGTPTVTVTAD